MKVNQVLFILLSIIHNCLSFEQFPINLGYINILFIKETNSIIYVNSSNSTQYSTMDEQGRIMHTYDLSMYQMIGNLFIGYFFIDSKLYLTQSGSSTYSIIDLAILEQNSSGFIQQISYPPLTFPCGTYQVIKIGQMFYLLCQEITNIQNNYLVSSPTFQDLFTSNNITRINQNIPNSSTFCNSNYFLVLGNQMLLDDGNFYTLDNQTQSAYIQLISKKWSIYVFNRISIYKIQAADNQAKILQKISIQAIGSLGNNYSDIIDFQNKSFIIIFKNDCFNAYDAENLNLVQTIPHPQLSQLNYFQHKNFFVSGSFLFELKYNRKSEQLEVTTSQLNQTYTIYSYKIQQRFRFQYGLTYLVQNCVQNCVQQLNSVQQILNFIPGCSEYIDISKQSCKVCNSYYQLSNGFCVPTCGQGYFESEGICVQCDQSCQTCDGALPTSCLICQEGLYFNQDKICKACDTNNGYMIDSKNNCICQDGYKLDKEKCVQLYLSYKSNTFSQSVVNQVTQQAQSSSKAAFASTTFLSSVQNLISSSSIGISINGLTCFKLSYLLLVNTALPQQIYAPLNAIKDQCPSHQFQILNLFALINKNNSEYQNVKYEQLDISYDILHTSGQALILFFICFFAFLSFYFLFQQVSNEKIKPILNLVYDKLFSGFIVQYFQLILAMFMIGINQQIKQFYYSFDSNKIGIQITLLLLFVPITGLILFYQYKFLNNPLSYDKNYNFFEITRKKIQNEAIFESIYRRNFMIIYLFYECFIETSSIIYINSDSIYQYSKIDSYGRVIRSYDLKPIQFTGVNFIGYFLIDNKLYLSQISKQFYYTIDLTMLEQNNPAFIQQNFYPSLKYPCSNFQVLKIGQMYYLLCSVSSNPQNNYVVSSPTFQGVFTSSSITRIDSTLSLFPTYCNSNDYLVLGNLMLLEDGNFYKIDASTLNYAIQLVSISFLIIFQSDSFQVYDVENLNFIQTIPHPTLNQINFFQHKGLTYFVQNCAQGCSYQLNSVQQILNFIPGCSEYIDISKQNCKICNSYYQLSDGICVPTCGQGYFESVGICLQCDQSCETCDGTLPTSCLICQDGLYFHQDKLCKVCDTDNGYMIDSQNNCVCQDGFKLYNQKCIQQYLSYKSGTFSQSVVNQVTQQAQISSKSAFASTTFLSSVQNLISSSGVGISINGITCFKLSYLLLVNTALPQQIYAPLNAIKDQCPSHQFQILNLFALINKNNSEYQNAKYEQLDISYDILHTSGQALVLFFICFFAFLSFYFLFQQVSNEKIKPILNLVYDKLFSGFIVQYFQLILAMFMIGINQQIKQFYYSFDSNKIGIQITLLLLFVPITALIFFYLYKYLNNPLSQDKNYNFFEITRKKIQNEAIFEKIQRKIVVKEKENGSQIKSNIRKYHQLKQ
ncbi:hypothetical protein ABPG74_017325 [Tetrahymena malaccensis]